MQAQANVTLHLPSIFFAFQPHPKISEGPFQKRPEDLEADGGHEGEEENPDGAAVHAYFGRGRNAVTLRLFGLHVVTDQERRVVLENVAAIRRIGGAG